LFTYFPNKYICKRIKPKHTA